MKQKNVILHDRIIASERMMPIGARPQIDPNLANPIRVPGETPPIPAEDILSGWKIDDVTRYGILEDSEITLADTKPSGIFVNDDGTKLYVYGQETRYIYQFTFGDAWDITTISFVDKYFAIDGGTGMSIDPSGTYLYISRDVSDYGSVYQYEMTTPWDITTLTYKDRMSIRGGGLTSIFVSDNNSHLYAINTSNTAFHYYMQWQSQLDTADLVEEVDLTLEYSKTLSGIVFNPAGDKMYLIERENSSIFEYDVAIEHYIDSSTNTENLLAMPEDGIQAAIKIASDDFYYTVGWDNDKVYQYYVKPSSGFVDDMANLSGPVNYGRAGIAHAWDVYGGAVKPDGSMYILLHGEAQYQPTNFREYSMVDNDLNSISFTREFRPTVTGWSSATKDLTISDDGLNLIVYEYYYQNKIRHFRLGTPWDITSIGNVVYELDLDGVFPPGGHAITVSLDGKHIYVSELSAKTIHQLDLGTEWELSTWSNPNKSKVFDNYMEILRLNRDGDQMIGVHTASQWLSAINFGTPFDIETAIVDSEKSINSTGKLIAFNVKPDGSQIMGIKPASSASEDWLGYWTNNL
jgi:DNA-binding beta-propeller fold protein YncE